MPSHNPTPPAKQAPRHSEPATRPWVDPDAMRIAERVDGRPEEPSDPPATPEDLSPRYMRHGLDLKGALAMHRGGRWRVHTWEDMCPKTFDRLDDVQMALLKLPTKPTPKGKRIAPIGACPAPNA
jgi:hypothetical protein